MLTTKESTSLNADIRDERGAQRVMLHATYNAQSFSLSVEVLDGGYVAANRETVEADVAQFVCAAMARAAASGIPLTVEAGV